MGVEEIRARTEARKAAGATQTYPEHAGRAVRAPAPRSVPLPLALAPCADLGERVPGQPCGSPLLRCKRHGDVTARFTACSGAQRTCSTCPDYRPERKGWLTIPEPPALDLTPTQSRALVTVVVGPEAQRCFAVSGPLMKRYAERVGADLVVLDWPGNPAWPISAKFAVGRVLDHYERIAYVDADVLLRPRCLDLFAQCSEHEFGFVDELPQARLKPEWGTEANYQRFRAEMGFAHITDLPWYMNTGVMVVPASHRELLLPPTRPMPTHHTAEQDHTCARLLESGLPYRLLDRRCNWQNWTDPEFRAAPADAVLHWSGAGGARRDRAAEMARFARGEA